MVRRIWILYCAGANTLSNIYAILFSMRRSLKGRPMLDVFFVAGGFAAFFVAILYVFACDRL